MCFKRSYFPTTLCGVLVFDSVSRASSSSSFSVRPPPPTTHTITSHTHKLNTQLCHILSVTYINLTHNFVTYHLSHCHIHTLNTQLCHIPSVTCMTSHTPSSHTIFNIVLHILSTQLCHILSVTYINLTHNFVTYHLSHCHIHTLNTQLCHIPSVTYMTSHTPSSHTIFNIVLHRHDFTHTQTPSSHTILHIVTHTITSHTHKLSTQLCHIPSVTYIGTLRGRRGTR